MWILAAVGSAFFAGLTAILAKCGIKKTDSDVATAVRTGVVLIFSWIMVFIVGSVGTIAQIGIKSLIFLIASGLATGASWICYFKALSMTDVNRVVPIDKSSTILTVIIAMAVFGETQNLPVRIIGVVLISVGTFLMIEKKQVTGGTSSKGWFFYAVLSAVFAALTSVLAKVGIDGVESNLGTAIRTGVVLIMAWIIVFAKQKQADVFRIGSKELIFIILSGIATGASWLCYYYAIKHGDVSIVVPIDKLSILVTVAFSCVFLREKIKPRYAIGLATTVAGVLIISIFAK